MEKKIGNLVFIFLLIQCSALFMVYRCFHTDGEAFGSFLIHTTLWHTLLLLFLILHKSEFANKSINTPAENIGEKLSLLPARINTANKITLCRISSVPLVAFLLKNHEIKGIKFVLTAVLVFVFLTDLFDGLIARKYNQETDIGRMLDSMSDYSLLTLVSVGYFTRLVFFLNFKQAFISSRRNDVFYALKVSYGNKFDKGRKNNDSSRNDFIYYRTFAFFYSAFG